MKSRSFVLVAIVVVVLAGSLYYAENASSSTSDSNSANGPTLVNIEILGGVGNGTVDLYSPATFSVREGGTVTLAVLNTDDNTHGLVIRAFGVDTGKILPGHTQRVTFVANQTGTFEYFEPPGYCTGGYGNVCNSIQHMTGNMTVTP